MRKITYLTLLSIFGLINYSNAQVSWDGDAGTPNWEDATNWSTDMLPGTTDEVVINDANVTVSASTSVARIDMGGSSELTINPTITLTVSGTPLNDDVFEIDNSASVINNGILVVSNGLGGTAVDGLYVRGGFENNGEISISNIGQHGLYVQRGNLTNNAGATITITDAGQVNGDGDEMYADDSGGVFGLITNNGIINISRTTAGDDGIYVNDGSSIENNGTISVSGAIDNGIRVDDGGIFNNNPGANFNVTGGTDDQILVDNSNAVFNNFGTCTLMDCDAGDASVYVIDAGLFINMPNGLVNISNSGNYGVQIDANGSTASIVNMGSFILNGGANDGIRLQESGTFNNLPSGIVTINNAGDEGIQIDFNIGPSTFNNNGVVEIQTPADHGMELFGNFNNNMGGLFMCTDAPDDGIRMQDDAFFNNDGDIRIDGSGSEDIETETIASMANTSNATFAPGSSPGDLEIRDDIDMGFSTIIFEIDGTTPITEYDQIINTVTGNSMTISSATLELVWGFTPAIGDCFTIVDGSGTRVGEFASVTTNDASINLEFDYSDATEVTICVVAALPVELISFDATRTEKGSQLNWTTASEQNNQGFEVHKSMDGHNWTTLGFVEGNGDSNESINYSFLDRTPENGSNYYRLKQMDFDGKYEYSNVVELSYNSGSEPTVHPNPVSDVLNLELGATDNAEIRVLDINGKVLWIKTGDVRQIPFDAYNAGIYFVQISTSSNQITHRIVKK